MSYAKNITHTSYTDGSQLLFCPFPAHGEITIVGSIAGGTRLAAALGAKESTHMIAELHAAMLMEGAAKKSKSDIQIALDSCGATLSFAADKDRLMFTAHTRAAYAPKVCALIAELLKTPTFPAQELTHLKERLLSELSLEGQNTQAQASIAFSQLLYTKDHPNYHASTAQSRAMVERITANNLRQYHAHAIDAGSLVVSIAGDMPKRDAHALMEQYFSRLPQKPTTLPAFEPAAAERPQQTVVSIEDKASIDYMVGLSTGITKDHTDYPALLLGMQILGNSRGFTGRLMKIVREKEGLTYGTYAYLAGFRNTDGFAAAWATFAPSLFEKGRKAIRREIKRIVTLGVTTEEFKRHRALYVARARVSLSNSGDIARAAHDVVTENHSVRYLETFPQKIAKLTKRQVEKALKKYLVLDKLSEAAAGPIKSID